MAQSYTRQSSFSDGDTITAALFNNEYNQLVNAFTYSSSSASSTGHRHDGTAGHGGNIHTIGDLDFLNKIVVDSTNNRWGFYVEVSSAAVEQIRLSDGVLAPVTDSDVDLGTSSLYFKNAYIDSITTTGNVSVGGNLDVTGTIDFSDSAITNVGSIQLDSIAGDADSNTSITFSGSDVITIAAAGENQVTFTDGAIVPSADNNIDLGTSSVEFKNAYFDGTVTSDAFAGPLTGDVTGDLTGTASLATSVTVSTQNSENATHYITFVDGSTGTQGIEVDTALIYNPSSGGLTIEGALTAASLDISGNVDIDGTLETDALSINGTTVTSTAAELNILDGVTSTAAELNILDGVTASATDINLIDGITNGTVIASKAIITDANKDISGGRNITISGELDAATLDISGNADIDGTLEADAYTVDGTALNEYIADTVGAMVSSNTESGITVAYEDGDNTLDFTVGTLNQDTTGTADNITVSANNSTDETVYPIFVDGATGSQGAESDTGLTYNPSTGMLTTTGVTATFTGNITGNVTGNTSGTAATVTGAAQSNITSLGTLTTLTVDNVIVNGTTIGHTSDTDLITLADGNVTIAGELDLTTLDVSGDADIDGTLEADAITVGGTALASVIAGTTVSNATLASTVTVSDSTANTNFPVVFHDESNALLDDTGALRYNPSTGELLVPKLTVAGTTTTADTVTMQASNAIVFEGATADANETTLSIVDPTSDHTQYLVNQGGYIPVLAAATTTQISSTPAELNLLDGSSANTVVNSKAVIYGSSGELAGTLSTAAQTNITSLGTLTTLTVDDITINGSTISDGGEFTIDAEDSINLDADGAIIIKQSGTEIGRFSNSSNNLRIQTAVSDADLVFRGNDGGSTITALTLDMSDAGKATFNNGIVSNAGVVVDNITIDGTEIDLSSGDLTIDAAGRIDLSADDNGEIRFYDGSLMYGQFKEDSSNLVLQSLVSDKDLILRGNDDGTEITALTLDMSDAGSAYFNNKVGIGTTSPAYGLDVRNTIYSSVAATTKNLTLGDSTNGTTSAISTNNENLLFYHDGSNEAMRIHDNGRVSINSTNAHGRLVIHENSSTIAGLTVSQGSGSGNALELNNAIGDGAGNLFVVTGAGLIGSGTTSPGSYNSNTNNFVIRDSGNGGMTISTGASSTGYIAFNDGEDTTIEGLISYNQSNDVMSFRTAETDDRLVIDGSGNVGIGSASPAAKVEISTGDNLDTLMLTSTDADANKGPNLSLYRNSSSPADGDMLGQIRFDGENSAGETISYAKTYAETYDITDGTEDGRYFITTMVDGSESVRMYMNFSETVFNDSSANIDLRVESNGLTHALFVDGGNDSVHIGNNSTGFHSSVEPFIVGSGSGDEGMAIFSGNASKGKLGFADAATDDSGSYRGYLQYDHSGDNLNIGAAGAEIMRVNSGGLLIGTTNNGHDANVLGHYIDKDGYCVHRRASAASLYLNRWTSEGYIQYFMYDGTIVGSVSVSDDATAFNTSSDGRLKDVTGEAKGLEVIKKLNPVSFNWKSSGKSAQGMIAQEVLEVMPECVSKGEENDYYQMDYSKLVTPLIKAVQEQQEQIEELKQQINKLKKEK